MTAGEVCFLAICLEENQVSTILTGVCWRFLWLGVFLGAGDTTGKNQSSHPGDLNFYWERVEKKINQPQIRCILIVIRKQMLGARQLTVGSGSLRRWRLCWDHMTRGSGQFKSWGKRNAPHRRSSQCGGLEETVLARRGMGRRQWRGLGRGPRPEQGGAYGPAYRVRVSLQVLWNPLEQQHDLSLQTLGR